MGHRFCGFPQIVLIFFFAGCSPGYTKYLSVYRSQPDTSARPDYGRLQYWAAHPDKKDPSDSIPGPLLTDYRHDNDVDVFFLHPTTFVSSKDTRSNAGINDADLNLRTDYTTILYQASVFNECRVFAPRYRQAHIRNYFTIDQHAAQKAFDTAYEDIRQAFRYYLEHENGGRPIIIAAHSQGTTHAKRLLKEFFEHQPLADRLIAAYIIGMPIPRNFFDGLPVCNDAAATGCVIDWRTYRRGYKPNYLFREDQEDSSLVVNPLTWTTTCERAPISSNKGAVLMSFNQLTAKVTDAQIHDGILWVRRPRFRGGFLIRTKNYHIGDINLFYLNIRENIRTRVRAYRLKKGQGL